MYQQRPPHPMSMQYGPPPGAYYPHPAQYHQQPYPPPPMMHGPPGLHDPAGLSRGLHPPPVPPPGSQFLTPPAVHGLSSLAAAADPAAGGSGGGGDDSPSPSSFSRSRSRSPGRAPASHHQISQKRKEQHRIEYTKHMKNFWSKQKELIEKTDYKRLKHDLPLARIKKIMKSDDEVRMISAEVPILFSKACELFILDLTMRAWAHTADTNRRTLQRSDVADAIMEGEGMDFLVDIVPREDDVSVAGVKKSDKAGEGAVVEEKVEAQHGMSTDKLLKALEAQINGEERDGEHSQGNDGGGPATAGGPTASEPEERKEQ